MAVLEVRNVKKVFGDNVILRGIDLDVQKGDVIVILGPSGSGKTTFLRCLNLLEKPDEGSMVQIPLHRITDSASNGSVFPVVTEHFSASSDHAFL